MPRYPWTLTPWRRPIWSLVADLIRFVWRWLKEE